MGQVTKKFKLLLWKNYLLRIRHKNKTVVEILLPLIFTIILVIIRGVIDAKHYSGISYPAFDPKLDVNETAIPKGTYILYAPNTSEIVDVMKAVELSFKAVKAEYIFDSFRDEETLLKHYRKDDRYAKLDASLPSFLVRTKNDNPVLAAVIFHNLKGDDINYRIRFPAALHNTQHKLAALGLKMRWFTEFVYEMLPLPRDREHPEPEDDFLTVQYKQHGGGPGYWKEGFLFLQATLDREIIKMKASSTQVADVDKFSITLNRYPYPKHISDTFVAVLQTQLPFFIMLSYMYPLTNISKSIAYEKEKRLKESMKIMGLPNWLHWTAWFTISFAFLFVSTFILTLLYKIPWYGYGLGILTYGDFLLLFVFFLAYAFSTITLGFLISAFFSTANSASTASGVVFFLTYFPYFFLRPRYNLLSKRMKLSMSIISNTAMAFGCQSIAAFEGTGAGIQWSTLAEGYSPDDTLTMLELIGMLLLDGVLYFLLAIYIEAVHPGDYGVPLPWYFPFTKWYWFNTPRIGSIGASVVPVDWEQYPKEAPSNVFEKEPKGHAGIQILGLTKIFGKKVAVNNLYLNFYENQVTALLGHNGAGKTTTMSMLTGIFCPTSGTAIVNGFDIRKDIKSVRGSLGLCPQHDVLFDELTVEEHLQFFALLKGVSWQFVPPEVDRTLGTIMLENKRHAQSQTLSGGMKRKLSVGIALIGGSKVVLLDEPTSGMDPGARRSTWDLITNEKKGRTIVLSTHFMDEADLLGDRIAIMAEGQVQCCGSSLFLKKKYGGGYHLIIVKEANCNIDEITNLLKKYVPGVEIDQNIGAELSYSLPDEKSSLFSEMFEELEGRKGELGIASYGCSITQMEEVFMRVGKQVEEKMYGGRVPELRGHLNNPSSSKSKSADDAQERNTGKISGQTVSAAPNPSCNNNISLIDDGKMLKDKRKSKQLTVTDVDKMSREANEIPGATTWRHTRNSANMLMTFRLLFQQLRAMMVKKWLYAIRNKILLTTQICIPVIFLIMALIMLSTLPDIAAPTERVIDLNDYSQLDGIRYTTIQCEKENSGICKAYSDVAKRKSRINFVRGKGFEEYILDEASISVPHVNFKYIVGLKASNNDTNLTGYFNNQPMHSSPLALNLISNAILREVTGNHKYTLTVSNYPLPFRELDKVENIMETDNEGFSIGLNISFGTAFLAASIVVFVIKERETNSKHLQFVSGVRFPIFWLAHYVFDTVIFVISAAALMSTFLVFQQKDFSELQMQGFFLLVMVSYSWGSIPLMYLFSFLFTVPSAGYTRMTFFNFLTGMATFLTVGILQLKSLGLVDLANTLEWVFMIFPNFDVGYSLTSLTLNRQFHDSCPLIFGGLDTEKICALKVYGEHPCCEFYPREYLGFKAPGIGRHLLYLFIIGFLSFTALFIVESKVVQRLRYKVESKEYYGNYVLDLNVLEDDDVAAENTRIRHTDMKELFRTETMVLRDLTKYYGRFLAVDKLCLGLKPGQCFGLLGVNGAGKTTTFKMLTGDIPITFGKAYIAGRSVKAEVKEVQRLVGYCPQFDALIPELTGRETIRLFARLRGIPEAQIDWLADDLADRLLFGQHIDKPCGTYSGGNKRKLSTAVALVGNPPLIFLDEPTTGMDPVARRHLWNAIINMRERGASVILTSHSMEECEALCTRLAIMVNGKFRCLGSTQHLKNKFGDGYTLIAQMEPSSETEERRPTRKSVELGRRHSSLFEIENKQEWEVELQPLRTFIEESFPGCSLKEVHPAYVHYHIKEAEGVTWAKIFGKMEEAKALFRLEAYAVGQISLEQIFLSFSRAQVNYT